VDRGVAAGIPASGPAQIVGVIFITDEQFSSLLSLGMATEAEIWIGLDEQLAIYGTVWLMASRATFPQRFVLENEASRLFAMTARALLIEPRHGETTGGLHDVQPVRVVALNAVHLALTHGMMLRQVELGMDIKVACKTRLGFAARINDEFPTPSADRDVPAAGAVT